MAKCSFNELKSKLELIKVKLLVTIRCCNITINTETLPKLGHTESDWIIDVEATTESLQDVLDILCNDKYIRQVYGATGNCRVHCQGYAPNNHTLEAHVRYLYNHNKGIRRLEWHMLMTTFKDLDGGVEYVRYKEPEHLEGEQS